MKKILFSIALIASGLVASAQVGVGTTDPQVSLQVDRSTVATDADGVLVPRVTVAQLNDKAAVYVAAQNGALVFITDTTGFAGKTSNVTATGFHYYNSTTEKWVAVGGAQAAVPYENIRGNRVTFTGTRNLQNSDFILISNDVTATTLNLPDLSSQGAAAWGRMIVVVNNNTTGNVTVNAAPTAMPIATTVLVERVRTFMWVGTRWYHIVP
jgi:hypothetical protein